MEKILLQYSSIFSVCIDIDVAFLRYLWHVVVRLVFLNYNGWIWRPLVQVIERLWTIYVSLEKIQKLFSVKRLKGERMPLEGQEVLNDIFIVSIILTCTCSIFDK